MRPWIALLLGLAATPAAAQTLHQDVYEGTIGKSPVVLQVLTYREGATTLRAAEYFYSKYRTPIALRAGKAAMTFTETGPDCYAADCPATATLTLTGAAESVSGTWQATGKRTGTAMALKRVATRDYGLTQDLTDASVLASSLLAEDMLSAPDSNPFLKRLYDTDLTDGPETRGNGVGYRMVSHRGTGVRYLRLTQHPDAAVLKTANARFDLHRYQAQMNAIDCAGLLKENGQGPGYGGFEEVVVKVAYASPSLMFVEEAGSTYCGGAHPNNFWSRTGYDLKTGGPLDLNRILKLYNRPAGWKPGDDAPETAEFTALQAKLKPGSPWMVAGSEIPECLAEDLGYGYSLSFNDKGLVFSLEDLPHVMGACMGEYYVVPYKELKSLWRPEARAYFPGL